MVKTTFSLLSVITAIKINFDITGCIFYTRLQGKTKFMNILLTPDLEDLVNEKMKSGQFSSPSEVVSEALRLLKEQDQLKELRREELRKEIMLGVEQMQQGKYRVYDSAEELSDEINRRGLERLEQRQLAEQSNGDC